MIADHDSDSLGTKRFHKRLAAGDERQEADRLTNDFDDNRPHPAVRCGVIEFVAPSGPRVPLRSKRPPGVFQRSPQHMAEASLLRFYNNSCLTTANSELMSTI